MGRITAGAALLSRLKRLGIDVIFANSGTDFPPIIEGLAEARAKGMPLPETLVMPFEGAATGMAYGYYLATGRPQAVMVHTNVGLANAALGAINAACEQIPMMLIGGRTPTLEKGRFGARTVPIGWGQEMLDQAGLVREACKWDYELRFPEQINDVIDRAHGIACSSPKGPVYISLPREVLCETIPEEGSARRPQMQPSQVASLRADLEHAADILAEAKHPVIFAQRGAGNERAFATLAELAEEWGIPVCQYWAVQLALPTDHPMAAGPDPKPLLEKADAILVIDSLAPWSPAEMEPSENAFVIQIGADPLHARTAVRNFRSDLSLVGDAGSTILALKALLDARMSGHRARNEERAATVGRTNALARNARLDAIRKRRDAPQLTKAWVSYSLSEALRGTKAAVFNELGVQMHAMHLDHPKAWFDGPHSGGLGWAFPAALGFKMADPERPVIAAMGDGSYIFSNPVACHQIAEARNLPIIVIVMNNAEWGAVRQSVVELYPNGHAARSNTVPLTALSPSPDFVRVAQGSRAWARKVATPGAFETALAEALVHTNAGKGLALIEVTIGQD
ncbi:MULTISPECIES: thiamine pyrophosphate-requiring protein [Chelativorans]|jgi:acetolactate synthase-1/2/3 large subunit|uniref:Thiamine pyrophosphate enzyme-like TPP-binding protein n=1 Tax=Chelativorans sp. (strain BNC1) TaxID=266779 RepID=Q11D50_CHESB|nr:MULTISPECIES: thiamine pyrophosphate-requiring protein [Chelativorans]